MAGVTNRGKYRILEIVLRGASLVGSGFAVFLATSAATPTADTNGKSELTEIATGNGYDAGGIDVDQSDGAGAPVGWDVLTEDDVNDRAYAQIEDLVWTATSGPIPSSGGGARWAIWTDRNATLGSREAWGYWDLISDRQVSDGQALTLQNCEVRANES